MRTDEYWIRRAEMLMEQGLASAEDVVDELERLYRSAGRNVDYEIKRLYERYAREYGLSYADAVREIAASEYKEWRMTLAEYVERINTTGDEALLRELNILSTRSRATRWQQVETAIKVNASELAARQESLIKELLGNQYQNAYYRQIFDIQQGLGYGHALEMLSSRRVAEVISYPWSGANYSERVWRNRDALTNNLRDTLTEGLIQGADTKQMARRIRDSMEVSMYRAETLVRTETAHIIEQGTMDGYGEAEVEEYEILATLDRRTSRICQQQDGKRYKVSEAVDGKNMPPFHPNCRTTTIPVIPEDEEEGQRAARSADGEYILVPADMKYEQWYEEFVEKPTKERVEASKAEYDQMQKAGLSRIPDIDKFAQQKYNNSPAYQKLAKRYENLTGGGEWAAVEFNPSTRADHFSRHGTDFSSKTARDYETLALRFVNQTEGKQILFAEDGVRRFYSPDSNEFASIYPDGTVRTYYKPRKGIKYWEGQVKKYGSKDD